MIRFHHRLTIATVVIFMAAGVNAQAQRTMKGQSVLGAEASYNGMSAGIAADYSQYTLNGFWYVGVCGNDYYGWYAPEKQIRYDHLSAFGGYLLRLAGTRSRSVNLYGGGEAFIGAELTDPFGELPDQFRAGIEHYRFLYGVALKILAEFFVSSGFAFTIFGSVPINFSSDNSNFNFNVGAGFRIML